jgi:hypothetical protein
MKRAVLRCIRRALYQDVIAIATHGNIPVQLTMKFSVRAFDPDLTTVDADVDAGRYRDRLSSNS